MAIQGLSASTDLVSDLVSKYNNSINEIPVGGTCAGTTLTFSKFGGGTFTVTGLPSGSTTSIPTPVYTGGSGSNSILPTSYGSGLAITGQNSTVAGGQSNTIEANACFIGAGSGNDCAVQAGGIVAGINNVMSGNSSFVGAGFANLVYATGSGVGSGISNIINNGGNYNSILGGSGNTVYANAVNSAIIAGAKNVIDLNVLGSSVLAGHHITASTSYTAYAQNLAIPAGVGNLYLGFGTNSIAGNNTLTAGTCTVATTKIVAGGSIVMLTPQSSLSGSLYINSVSDGVSFQVKSTNTADTCSFGWVIIQNILV